MLNITISGYGRMGHEVEKIAIPRGHRIAARLDNDEDWQKLGTGLINSDVVIDFSQPDTAVPNILRCFDLGIPIVTGTTGWFSQIDKIRSLSSEMGQTIFFAPNFSIGVNILFEMNKRLAALMNDRPEYEVSLQEIHHIHKLDAPSGTAIKIADDILKELERKKSWVNHETKYEDEIPVISRRLGEETGTHIITWDSESDRIVLSHQAHSRAGFALGAVLAAEWIIGKKGFFEMKDLLELKD